MNGNGIKIAFIGPKGVGKDYILSKLTELDDNGNLKIEKYGKMSNDIKNMLLSYTRLSIGDYLKVLSTSKNDINDIISGGIDNFNFDYLKEDFNYILNNLNDEGMKKTYKKVIELGKNEFNFDEESSVIDMINNNIFNDGTVKLSNDLKKDFKLSLIELFKNQDKLTTRHHLQIFADVIKNKTNNPFFISEALCSELKDNENYINTDTRTITDLIDLTINGFNIIKLDSESIKTKILGSGKSRMYSNNAMMQHFSETELSLTDADIGITLNTDGDFIGKDGIKRLTDEQIYKSFIKIFKDIDLGINNNLDLNDALLFKSNLKKSIFFNKQAKYLESYGEYFKDLKESKISGGKVKESIIKNMIERYGDYALVKNEVLSNWTNQVDPVQKLNIGNFNNRKKINNFR